MEGTIVYGLQGTAICVLAAIVLALVVRDEKLEQRIAKLERTQANDRAQVRRMMDENQKAQEGTNRQLDQRITQLERPRSMHPAPLKGGRNAR